MVRRDQRERTRRIERFAPARRDGTEEDQATHSPDKAGAGGHQRPEDKRCRDDPLAAEPVAEESGKRRRDGQRTKQRGVDPADLEVCQVKFVLYGNRQKPKQHAIRLVEEEGAREERQHDPLVAGVYLRSIVHVSPCRHRTPLTRMFTYFQSKPFVYTCKVAMCSEKSAWRRQSRHVLARWRK